MDNEYLKEENYRAEYNESINNLKNNPEVVELDKLCYQVFKANPTGEKLLAKLFDRFILNALSNPANQNYRELVVYHEGFRDCIRMLRSSCLSHEQRIKEGKTE